MIRKLLTAEELEDRKPSQMLCKMQQLLGERTTINNSLLCELFLPFGLRNAAQTFQRFIDQVLRGLPFTYAYIDDLLIASSTANEHEQHLRAVFQRLDE